MNSTTTQHRALVIDWELAWDFTNGQIDIETMISELKFDGSGSRHLVREITDTIYVTSKAADKESALIIIDLTQNGPLRGLDPSNRYEAFTRIVRICLHLRERRSAIPNNWRPFHQGSRISIQSNPLRSGESGRIIIEANYLETDCIFAFGLDRSGIRDLLTATPDEALFTNAFANYEAALKCPPLQAPNESEVVGNAILLTNPISGLPLEKRGYFEWYEKFFTKQQQKFVDLSMDRPIRLVGPAGSGKTLALVVKALKHIKDASDSNTPFRLLYLTHAMSSVALTESIFDAIDDSNAIYGEIPDCEISIDTLYSLANQHMKYDFGGFSPISLDGVEGRQQQMTLLANVLSNYVRQDWITMKSGCSETFCRYMNEPEGTQAQRFFLFQLLNEFSCVLDSEGIRKSPQKSKRYLTEERKPNPWMMQLEPGQERVVALELYDRFRGELRSQKAIGIDQLVSDYLNFLESFKWEALRGSIGYNAIFIDETHLFNRQERMVFRHLLKDDSIPSVVMAYDVRQSPLDTFVGVAAENDESINFWKDRGLGATQKVELEDVFRYTPEIAAFLSTLDSHFPGAPISEDWPLYIGKSVVPSGPKPVAKEYSTTEQLYFDVFERARDLQRSVARGKRVAVLCASYDLFDQYLQAGQYRDAFIPIRSRDEIPTIAQSPKKFIFSLPEYVAGLQFEFVFLIEVNKDEIPSGAYSTSTRRKFLSQIYLGASRAEKGLEISASKTHGGLSEILNEAIQRSLLIVKQ